MMKHLLLYISLLVSSNTFVVASEIDGDYDCQGMGLKISQNEVILGKLEFNLCPKQGVVYWFTRKECNVSGVYDSYEFDEVTHRLSARGYEGVEWQCRKHR